MFRHPVVGGGAPLWPAVPSTLRFELVQTGWFTSVVAFERHRRVR